MFRRFARFAGQGEFVVQAFPTAHAQTAQTDNFTEGREASGVRERPRAWRRSGNSWAWKLTFRACPPMLTHDSPRRGSFNPNNIVSFYCAMTDIEVKVVAAWKEAAADLGIQFTSPFVIISADGRSVEHLGLVHKFGRRKGTLITVLHKPSEKSPHPAGDDYYLSTLGSGYGQYNRQYFIDTLDDWQFSGPERERPAWYTGKYWGQEAEI